jgi:hypothetical protein
MSLIEILGKDVPHPFTCYPTTTQLNQETFEYIKGIGEYKEFSWH